MDASRQDGAPDLSAALSTLLSDPELMSRISGIVNGTSSAPSQPESTPDTPPPPTDAETAAQATDAVPPPGNTAGGLGGLLSNPDVMAKLPAVMATIAPMLGGEGKGSTKNHSSPPRSENKHTALLCALKPYLSPRRCQAIDYIIKLEKIGSLLHTIK